MNIELLYIFLKHLLCLLTCLDSKTLQEVVVVVVEDREIVVHILVVVVVGRDMVGIRLGSKLDLVEEVVGCDMCSTVGVGEGTGMVVAQVCNMVGDRFSYNDVYKLEHIV